MSAGLPCEECGTDLPVNAPQGLCPRCLVGMGLHLGAEQTGLAAPTEKVGDRIGHYKLIEPLGEGGCGTVYLAEQEEPVRRNVALKVIKWGMETRKVIARFAAERQALALMDHPYIAKVYDAGVVGEAVVGVSVDNGSAESHLSNFKSQIPGGGRPYFVMELVRGLPITQFCDREKLSMGQRLGLFVQVCQAVQHAHQKGIIHRDLKPSNILVTTPTPGDHGVPKIIDFGIAKATQEPLSEQPLTELQPFMGTPAYMSPEQVGGHDVDTRTDIYALGVLLYELLSGWLPFDPAQLRQAGLEKLCRTIREEEPARPSARLSTVHRAELAAVACRRQTEPAHLLRLLRGDLDWIVMKTLEKDRARRYESAAALAEDIQRHLRHEPVTACPPSTVYQFRKFSRRHRTMLTASAAVAAVLVAGVIVSTWLAVRATRAENVQRQLAEQAQRARAKETKAREKSEQVAQFLERMLRGVSPSVALGRDTRLLREILDKTAASLATELKNQPEVEADLRSTIGEVYRALSALQPAEAMQREALRIRQSVLGPEHRDVAHSLNALANVMEAKGNTAEAETLYRTALALQRKLNGNEHPNVVAALSNLGDALGQHDPAAAEETLREALALSRKLHRDPDPGSPNIRYSLALVLKERGKLDEAESLLREALAQRRQLLPPNHPDVALTLNTLGNLLRERDRLDEAESNLSEALAIQRNIYDTNHPAIATSLGNLALLLQRRGKLDQAEALCRESLDIYRNLPDHDELKVATSLNNLAMIQSRRGHLPLATETYREALALRQKLLGPEHPSIVVLLNNLGSVLRQQAQLAEAEQLHRQALALAQKVLSPTHLDVGFSWSYLGEVLKARKEFNGAAEAFGLAVPFMKKLYGDTHLNVASALRDQADALLANGDLNAAAPLFREALAIQRKRLPDTSTRLETSVYELAEILYRAQQYAEAEPLYREAIQKRQTRLPPDDDALVGTTASLARLLCDWAWREGTNPVAAARAQEAESLLRECLVIRTRTLPPNSSRLADTKSRLGAALSAVAFTDGNLSLESRRARYADAEPLLLESAEALRQSGTAEARYYRDALERVVRFYKAWDVAAPNTGKSARLAEWQKRL